MFPWLRRHRKAIFVATVAVFLGGVFVGLGGYYFSGLGNADAVASVGGSKIPYLAYQARVNQYVDFLRSSKKDGKDVPDDVVKEVKQEVLREMIVDKLLSKRAEAMGIRVTDLELNARIRSSPRFQRNGAFDQALYFQTVGYAMNATPEEYERREREAMLSSKLKQLIYESIKPTPGDLLDEYKRAHGGGAQNFAKDRDKFFQSVQQARAVDLINFYLKQITTQTDVQSFLDKREQG